MRFILLTAWCLALGAGIAAADTRQPLYYQDPAGKADFSPTPKKDAAGRDYTPVYEDASEPAPVAKPATKGRVLYYRNPMGLPDTSPVPKKDSMGMDYVPVYEDAANAPAGTVTVSPDRVQVLGVRTEAAARRSLVRAIRAVGTLAADERRITLVAPRFEGWIETLLVNTTGEAVTRGQILFNVYSPDLVQAQQDFLIARRAGMGDAGLQRLRNLGVTADDIARLQRNGAASHTLAVAAPADGVVIEKTALAGMYFRPGDTLYRIVDVSSLWLLADVFEQDLSLVQIGAEVKASFRAWPNRIFSGRITFIYPTINPATRTVRVRVDLANSDGALKPDMYATAEIGAPVAAAVVTVPVSAVIDSGTRQAVLVARAPGKYEPRAVTLGQRNDTYVEIRDGLADGETVVTGANFLIDAESNLRAALQNFAAPEAKP